jgi:DNA replicative helicase MCM subunit Mcm2 (Cdc46/Mcm family)
MSEQQFAFLVKELVRLSYECPKCKTFTIFDIREEKFGVPQVCATCLANIPELAEAILAYRNFYKAAERGHFRVQLRTEPKEVTG